MAVRYPAVPDIAAAQVIHVMGLGISSNDLPAPASFNDSMVAREPPRLWITNHFKGHIVRSSMLVIFGQVIVHCSLFIVHCTYL